TCCAARRPGTAHDAFQMFWNLFSGPRTHPVPGRSLPLPAWPVRTRLFENVGPSKYLPQNRIGCPAPNPSAVRVFEIHLAYRFRESIRGYRYRLLDIVHTPPQLASL